MTQVISIPELKLVIKEIQHYVLVCKNCSERIRTTPRRRSNDVVYDASVKSLVVYLSVVQFLPYERIASFLRDASGLTPSEDSLVNRVNEAKRNAQPVVDRRLRNTSYPQQLSVSMRAACTVIKDLTGPG